jgi:hypothetical protein
LLSAWRRAAAGKNRPQNSEALPLGLKFKTFLAALWI